MGGIISNFFALYKENPEISRLTKLRPIKIEMLVFMARACNSDINFKSTDFRSFLVNKIPSSIPTNYILGIHNFQAITI